jgi:amino acid transporter
MSVFDAFVYNFLSMGVIFPWTYLWGPASFPGGHVELAILLTFLIQVPISLAYCLLATVLPVTGGDYVYQTRAFGRWGFVSVMSGFVIWILQWIALSGWLFTVLGLAPLLLSLGVRMRSSLLIYWAISVQTPWGIFIVTVALALLTTLFLTRGLRLYVKVQRYLFAFTLLAVGAVVFVYLSRRGDFAQHLDLFISRLGSLVTLDLSPRTAAGFTDGLQSEVIANGVNLSPPFGWWSTLGLIPIAWTSLQWATYSVEQNTEIAEADRFWKQFIILVLSALAVAVLLILVALVQRYAASSGFVMAISAGYWTGQASAQTGAFLKNVLQPFPNVLAMAVTESPLLCIVIALGFFANAFQVTCNCFVGVTRILVAMSADGFFPRSLRLEEIDVRRHAPVRAHWYYFFASLPWIACYNFVPAWANWTLGVTFACGYVFTFSTLATTRIPTKMRSIWKASELANVPRWVFRVIGLVGFFCGAAMVCAYLIVPQLGITGTVPYLIVFGIIALSILISQIAIIREPLVEKTLAQPPPEAEQFFEDKS